MEVASLSHGPWHHIVTPVAAGDRHRREHEQGIRNEGAGEANPSALAAFLQSLANRAQMVVNNTENVK